MTTLAGVDVGGTTCGVSLGTSAEGEVEVTATASFDTPDGPGTTLDRLVDELDALVAETGARPAAVGVSCGGPLDSDAGLVHAPPNLPDWDGVDVVNPFAERFGVPAALENDANAGALAEWQWGAGRGYHNVVFLTFGTGMGAGLILDGSLYAGTNDMAGEVGHVRLAPEGPVGYRKAGSFEGFCSGSGIERQARARAERLLEAGDPPAFCKRREDLPSVTAARVGEAAQAGDEVAREILRDVGTRLGQGIAVLVDVVNPERVIVGSIYPRQQSLLEQPTKAALREEAIERSRAVCEVVPPGLGERVGDFAALAVAANALDEEDGNGDGDSDGH
jgi:glucokinase